MSHDTVSDAAEIQQTGPRRRWGSRLLTVLLVLLVLLGGLLVVADRVGASVAEQRIRDQVKQEVASRGGTTAEPEVEIGGFPFLTQVLDGRYESISILLRDVEGEGVRLPRLDVTAHDVSAPIQSLISGDGPVVAKTVDGTATISYASVAALIDRPGLTLAERDGRLGVRYPVEILGQRLVLTGVADVTPDDQVIRVRFDQLDVEDVDVPPQVERLVNSYARQISVNVRVPDLPYGLSVREVRPLPEGLAVTAIATDVPITGA